MAESGEKRASRLPILADDVQNPYQLSVIGAPSVARKGQASRVPKLSEAEIERQQARWMRRCDLFEQIIRIGIPWGCGLAMVYCGIALPIVVSAGQTTSVTYLVDVLLGADLHVWIAWGAAAAMGAWAMKERNQRWRERKVKDERIKAFEQEHDSNRESSGMNVSGTKAIAPLNSKE